MTDVAAAAMATTKKHAMKTRSDTRDEQQQQQQQQQQDDHDQQQHKERQHDQRREGSERRRAESSSGSGSTSSFSDDEDDDDAMIPLLVMITDRVHDDDDDDDDDEEGSRRQPADRDTKETPFKHRYSREERRYLKSVSEEERHSIESAERTLLTRGACDGGVPLRFRVLQSGMPDDVKGMALGKLDACASSLHGDAKTVNWLTALVRIPFGRFWSIEPAQEGFLQRARNAMDDAIYGLDDVKHQFMITIAKWLANPEAKGIVLGVQGPPGVGKTTLVKDGLCRSLGIPCRFVSLGGANDSSFLDGHSFTYEGSMWGRIVEEIMQAGIMNPILCFDELDKVASNVRGAEIYNVLLHLTDPAQNDSFADKYFEGVRIDLSRCIIVFTYNDASLIPPILHNRIIEVNVPNYSDRQKVHILQHYMLPTVLREYSQLSHRLVVPPSVAQHLVARRRGNNLGMRDIKHDVQYVIGAINLECMMSRHVPDLVEVSIDQVNKLLDARDANARTCSMGEPPCGMYV